MTTLNVFTQFSRVNAVESIQVKPNTYGNFKASQLDETFRSQFDAILNQITGKKLDDNHSVLSFKSDIAGFADKTYVSSVVRQENNSAIHLGTEIVPIQAKVPDNITLTIEEVVYDRYRELSLTAYDEDADTTIAFPLRLSEEAFKSMLETGPDGKKAVNGRKLSTAMAKGKLDVVVAALSEGKTGGSSAPLTEIKDLPQQTLFPVTNLKTVAVNYQGVPATSYIVTVNHESTEHSFWLPSNLKLAAEIGTIAPNQTSIAYYLTEPNKAGKQYVKGYTAKITRTVDAVVEQMKTTEPLAVEALEPVKEDRKLPFSNIQEAIDWGMSLLGDKSKTEVSDMLANAPKDDNGSSSVGFYNMVMEMSVVPF